VLMFEFFFFFWQSIKDGTPTRAKAYIKTQKKKKGWKLSKRHNKGEMRMLLTCTLYCFTYVCD